MVAFALNFSDFLSTHVFSACFFFIAPILGIQLAHFIPLRHGYAALFYPQRGSGLLWVFSVKFPQSTDQFVPGQRRIDVAEGPLSDDMVIWTKWYLMFDIVYQLMCSDSAHVVRLHESVLTPEV